ncbi:unnamed protein product, partial [marine sediment metagenome]
MKYQLLLNFYLLKRCLPPKWLSGVSNDFYFDPSGNATFAGNVTINGSIAGNSNNTTEVGTYSTGAIKRIRMVQGGELHFGDTTTGAPL